MAYTPDNATARLLDRLIEEGLPVRGIQVREDGSYRVEMEPGSTEEQRSQAEGYAAQYQDKSKKPRPINDIYQDVRALPPAEFQKTMAGVAAVVIRENPQLATRLGIPVSGDQDK
jgi:hypothetical protein